MEKTINPMKSRDSLGLESINTQIREILDQASIEIVPKLIIYYDQAVIDESYFVRSLIDQLAALSLSPDETCEMDEFQTNFLLKQNTIRTK